MILTPDWRFVADGVMGGLSSGRLTQEDIAGRRAARLTGDVSLENNGGFIQMAFNWPEGTDASRYDGLSLMLCGNGETYDLRLRTTDLNRPWQSYRAPFIATKDWTEQQFRFASFTPYRTQTPLELSRLRRVGVVAVGRAFNVDVAVAELRLF